MCIRSPKVGWHEHNPRIAVFQTPDAFELVDDRHVGELRDAVASMGGAFSDRREVRLGGGGLTAWFDTFHALKQWEVWQAHGKWIRETNPHLADNIRENFEAASRVTDAQRHLALFERERLRGVLGPHLAPDTVLCLPTAWTIAPLTRASAEDLTTNRRKDLTLGSVAGLLGEPEVSIPIVAASRSIGLSLLAAPGEDLRLLVLRSRWTPEPDRRVRSPRGQCPPGRLL
jgi:amidase